MNPTSALRLGSVFASSLGFGERLRLSASDRAIARAVDAGMERVEAELERQVRFADPMADVSGRYLLDAGGKRVRPVLTLLTAHLGSGISDAVITAAAAIEITHLASLYHDDVMDSAEQRRGVPSVQTVWGNSVAILTGDLLFARASQLMASLGERAIRVQADTFERLVLGQLHETLGPQSGDDPREHYLRVLADKTGALIAAAAQCGVVFSNADPDFERPLVEYGEYVGVAFQLVDDVIDLSSGPETGKLPGTDLRAGVSTLPLLNLRQFAAEDAGSADLLDRIEQRVIGADDSDEVRGIVAELSRHKATEASLVEAHSWADRAVAALRPLPDGAVTKALRRFAETIVERTS